MGSRITRAVFKKEREMQIRREQDDQIRRMAGYFMVFFTCMLSFLFGYLYRPYLNNPNSIGVVFLVLILLLYAKIQQISKIVFWNCLALLFIIIFTAIIGVPLNFLKMTLIISIVTLVAITLQNLIQHTFLQSLSLWLQFQFYSLGIHLSLSVEKINTEANQILMGQQEGMLVKIIFTIIATMAVILVSTGKKIIQLNNADIKQINVQDQMIYIIICSPLLFFCYIYKRQTEQSFIIKFMPMVVASMTVLLTQHFKKDTMIPLLVVANFALSYMLTWITLSESLLQHYLSIAKLIGINLMMYDGLQKWIKSISSGIRKPFIVIFIYLTVYYLAFLSQLGLRVWHFLSPLAIQLTTLVLYLALHVAQYMVAKKNYNPIAV